jgi:hypothetical protein
MIMIFCGRLWRNLPEAYSMQPEPRSNPAEYSSHSNVTVRLLVLLCGSLLLFGGCKSVPVETFLTDESTFYLGELSVGDVRPGSRRVEFIVDDSGWSGFEARSFILRMELRQGITVSAKSIEYEGVNQPFTPEDSPVFRFPIREVTFSARGGRTERLNLEQDFQACLQLLEWDSEVTLAQKCYEVSGFQLQAAGPVLRFREAPYSSVFSGEMNTSEIPTGSFYGAFLSADPLGDLDRGVLRISADDIRWTPAEEGQPTRSGTREQQGELLLVRLSDTSQILLLKVEGSNLRELNSGVQLKRIQ